MKIVGILGASHPLKKTHNKVEIPEDSTTRNVRRLKQSKGLLTALRELSTALVKLSKI